MLPNAKQYLFNVSLNTTANLILCVNGTQWLYQEGKSTYSVDVSKYMKANAANTIDVYVTNSFFPSNVIVKAIQLKKI